MDQKEIDALEPKYTGNQRDLTEGEAAAIKNDPANDTDDELAEGLEDIPGAGALGVGLGSFRRT